MVVGQLVYIETGYEDGLGIIVGFDYDMDLVYVVDIETNEEVTYGKHAIHIIEQIIEPKEIHLYGQYINDYKQLRILREEVLESTTLWLDFVDYINKKYNKVPFDY
jgi:hypothetical protein